MNSGVVNTSNTGLIVALIGAVATTITAFATIFFTSRNELKMKSRDLKEEKYIGFLKLIIDARGNYCSSEEAMDINKGISETLQMIFLVGNDEVINCTLDFIKIFTESKSSDEQNILYSEMIKAMRRDLYGKKRIRNHPKELELILFR